MPLPAAYTLIELDETGSTNDAARRLAGQGASHLTVVWAKAQTRGRGRLDRRWTSSRGNMFWSVILRPAPSWPDLSTLPLMTAVAIGRTLGPLLPDPSRLQYRWPNDVLVGGKKVSGILVETRLRPAAGPPPRAAAFEWLVVGVGLNVASHPSDTPYAATDLRAEGAAPTALEDVVALFSREFLSTLGDWSGPGHARVLGDFRDRLRGLGERARVATGTEAVEGVLEDLAPSGELLLRDADGRLRRISAGDVFFAGSGEGTSV